MNEFLLTIMTVAIVETGGAKPGDQLDYFVAATAAELDQCKAAGKALSAPIQAAGEGRLIAIPSCREVTKEVAASIVNAQKLGLPGEMGWGDVPSAPPAPEDRPDDGPADLAQPDD